MKSIFSRSLFAAFLVVAGFMSSYAQTTVTLPTIPCSNCNGPGAFATTAPACTPALVGAPLTMSWGTATGATSYTIMIATDAAMSQNVAAHTQTGTTLSVPAYALKPSTTYYWTVFANNATGSTKATGGVCSFITNTTWTGTSATGGFPNGFPSDQQLSNGINGGYYTCQKGDGTCASGDNLVCNPTFLRINNNSPYAPNWLGAQGGLAGYNQNWGVTLPDGSVGIPSTGTTTAYKTANGGSNVFQQMYLQNSTANAINYKIAFSAVATTNADLAAIFYNPYGGGVGFSITGSGDPYAITYNIGSTWAQYNLTFTYAAGRKTSQFAFATGGVVYITDVLICKL